MKGSLTYNWSVRLLGSFPDPTIRAHTLARDHAMQKLIIVKQTRECVKNTTTNLICDNQ